MVIIISILAIFIIAILVIKHKEDRKQAAKKQEKEAHDRVTAVIEREERAKAERAEEEEREKRLGKLTKHITYYPPKGKLKKILVYDSSQTVIIGRKEYKFSDIISCHVESNTIKGKEMYVTTPDRYQMAQQQFLWGMGQKYNVTSYTQVVKEPDKTEYKVCISVNSLTNPLIVLCPHSQYEANEINALMNVIIHQNQQREQQQPEN